MIYLAIFLSKILENTLATLRIILVSNGKKKSGAIIQGLVMLTWIMVTGFTIININNNIFKIIAFCLGAIVGSYLGSMIEEKLALGIVKLSILSTKYKEIYSYLKNYHVSYHNQTISIISKRKQIPSIIKMIKHVDSKAIIISEKIKIYGK